MMMTVKRETIKVTRRESERKNENGTEKKKDLVSFLLYISSVRVIHYEAAMFFPNV